MKLSLSIIRGAALILVILIFPQMVKGQSHPSFAVRQRIVDSLNASLGRSDTTVNLGTAIAEMANALGNCDTLGQYDIKLSYVGGYVELSRKLRGRDTIYLHIKHQLSEDLNKWLRTVWAMELQDIPGFDTLNTSCPGAYYCDTTRITSLIDSIKGRSTENAILQTTYDMNGIPTLGSDFLSFTEYTPRTIWYIIDSALGKKYLSSAYLQIRCGTDTFQFGYTISTAPYDTSCGIQYYGTSADPEARIKYNLDGAVFSWLSSGPPNTDNAPLREIFNQDTIHWDTDSLTSNDMLLGGFTIDSMGYLTFSMYHTSYSGTYRKTLCKLADFTTPVENCSVELCSTSGTFALDSSTGRITYNLPPGSPCGSCSSQPIPCLEFCDAAVETDSLLTSLITLAASTYSDQWGFDTWEYRENLWWHVQEGNLRHSIRPNYSEFELGRRGKWRVNSPYTYRDTILGGSALFGDVNERNYFDAGVFSAKQFKWDSLSLNDSTKWLRTSTITAITPHGEPIENRDDIGLYSSMQFNSPGRQPSIVAENAQSGAVSFNSFEPTTGRTDYQHAGNGSYLLPDTSSEAIAFGEEDGTAIPTQWISDGLLVKVWVKQTYHSGTPSSIPIRIRIPEPPSLTIDTIQRIAQSGEWTLYQGITHDASQLTAIGFASIRISSNLPGDSVWIDDFVAQPLYAKVSCYVYDPASLRLMTQFDDQHFGVYYQYNSEGKLVRKIRETERGFKTLQETQYHTPGYDIAGVPPAAAHKGAYVFPTQFHAPTRQPTESTGERGESNPSKFDILDVQVTPDGHSVKVFGSEHPRLPDIRDLKLPDIDSLHVPGIPNIETVKLLVDFNDADQQLDSLARQGESAVSAEAKEAINQKIEEISDKRRQILERLGITEEEARELVKEVRQMNDTKNTQDQPERHSQGAEQK